MNAKIDQNRIPVTLTVDDTIEIHPLLIDSLSHGLIAEEVIGSPTAFPILQNTVRDENKVKVLCTKSIIDDKVAPLYFTPDGRLLIHIV